MKNKYAILIAFLLFSSVQLYAQYAYNVSQAVYAGDAESFYVGGEVKDPFDFVFNISGTQMFVISSFTADINEYNLSIAYDVSTAVYAGVMESFSVSNQETSPYSLTFTPDGLKLFVMGYTGYIYEYTLSAAYDVSTAVYEGDIERFYVGNQGELLFSMKFSLDGMKMFVIDFLSSCIVQYSLTTAYDISSAVYDGYDKRFYIGDEERFPSALMFTPEGTKMYVMGVDDDDINQYSLSTAYDVSTAVYDGETENLSVKAQGNSPHAMAFNTDGTKLYVSGYSFENDNIFEYDLTNVPPVVSGTLTDQVVNDAIPTNIFTSVSAIDGNGKDMLSGIITLSQNSNGVLSGNGLTGSGPYFIEPRSQAEFQDVLQALIFDATDNSAATTIFTMEITDGNLTTLNNTTTVTATTNPSVTSIEVVGDPGLYATTVDFEIVFDESVIGVDQDDFLLNTTEQVLASITDVSGYDTNYTVTISDISGDGVLSLELVTTGTGITDATSNAVLTGLTSNVHIVSNVF